MKQHLVIAVSLLYLYGILDAHPIDVGLPSPLKELLHDEAEAKQVIDEASQILSDPESTQEEIDEAYHKLDQIGRLA